MSIYVQVEVTVRDGQQSEFEETARALKAQAASEPGTLSYRWFSHTPGSYTVLEEYVDAAASAAHNKGNRALLGRLVVVSTIDRINVYGEDTAELKGLAEGLPNGTAHIEAI